MITKDKYKIGNLCKYNSIFHRFDRTITGSIIFIVSKKYSSWTWRIKILSIKGAPYVPFGFNEDPQLALGGTIERNTEILV